MNILLLNFTPRGGMLHYASQFANALCSEHHVAVGIASYYTGDLFDQAVIKLSLSADPSPKAFFYQTCNIIQHIQFLHQVRRFKPDYIHFMDNHPWYLFYALYFFLHSIPLYTTQHDPIPHSGEKYTFLGIISQAVNTLLRRLSKKVIVHGEGLKKYLTDTLHVAPEKVISVHHGNYNFLKDHFSLGGIPTPDTFLFFGRIRAYKGLDILLQSLRYVEQQLPNYHLIIAGEGDITSYHNLLQQHASHITVYNYEVADEDLWQYAEQAEFVVLPYKDATGSGVVPLAYAFSKAVIVTDVGELAKAVENGVSGLVIPPQDPELLGEKIISLLIHKDKTKRMGQAGRAYSEDVLSRKKITRSIYF